MCEDKYNTSDGLGLWWNCQRHFDEWLNNWKVQAALARKIANLPENVEWKPNSYIPLGEH